MPPPSQCYLQPLLLDTAKSLCLLSSRRQVIIVDPAAPSPGDYTTRTEVETGEYEQAVIFDHVIGRRT